MLAGADELKAAHVLLEACLALSIAGTIAAGVYFVLGLLAALKFRRGDNTRGDFLPPVSVLKPVHGMEPFLRGNIESFFRQDYPHYELIFCARSLEDPAILLAKEVAASHPGVPARFLASGEPAWTNPKVFSMSKLLESAAHDTVLFSDSDVHVSPGYLRSILQPMADPNVGLVTCAFRAQAAPGIWSLLAGLSQTVEFASGVLVANMLEGMKFGLGPTLLTRKSVMEAIGGCAFMADLLADDFWIGNKCYEHGYKVILSSEVVDHTVAYKSLARSMRHATGWMKNTRRSRPLGHLGTGLTYAMPFGLLGMLSASLLGHVSWGIELLLVACANRIVQAWIVGGYAMRSRFALRWSWLNPVSDLLGFASWCGGYLNSTIDYRGDKYTIEPGGVIRLKARRKNGAAV